MQAMSFAVHIPLVCFGIAFPAMVLFLEGLWLRTGDPLYRALAKRWSRAMLILFAVGVVTGTILSFEMGLLWPEFMATFGDVFGLAFMIEGFSFFVEAIFIAIYVYGWDRLPRRTHFLAGIPMVIAGVTGSFMVIAVNGWMNQPAGFSIRNGEVVDVKPLEALFNDNLWHELVHMYLAGFIVAAFLVASVYAYGWLRGRRDRHHRIGLAVALSVAALAAPAQLLVGDWAARTVAVNQPIKLAAFEGLHETTKGAPFSLLGDKIEIPDMLSLLAFHDPNATVTGLDSVPPDDRPPTGHREAHVPDDGVRRQRPGRARPVVPLALVAPPPPAQVALVLPIGRAGRARGARHPDLRLDHDRGRPPAVGRLRGDAHRGARSPARAGSRSGSARSAWSTSASRRSPFVMLRRLSRDPLEAGS